MLCIILGIGKYPKKGSTSSSHMFASRNSAPTQVASANHGLLRYFHFAVP
jgi:hypothetical protein